MIDPTSGEIICADHDIKDYPEDYFYDYSYLTTDEIFNHDFSIQYYLNFWAKLSESNESLKSVIHYFELENLLNLKIKQISSGWKKRLLLSKLMIENRLLWFLDEPFNFLDEKGRDSLINMINSRRLSGGIVILTSNQKIDHFKDAMYLNIDEYK